MECFSPIGVVARGLPRGHGASRYGFIGEIHVYPEYIDGLRGLEDYSFIYVVWVLDRAGEPLLSSMPKTIGRRIGVFATRSPRRPNPIGLSIVKLLCIKDGVLHVKGLDAWTGSPVLDIKPYTLLDAITPSEIKEPPEAHGYWARNRARYCGEAPWLAMCRENGWRRSGAAGI